MNAYPFLSITGTITAVCALGLSIWEGTQSRRHDRLSVRPLLSFNHEKLPDGRALLVKNNGLGPAILERFQIFVNGSPVNELQEGGWSEVVRLLGIRGFAEYHYMVGDEVLDSGEERTVLRINCKGWSAAELDVLDNSLLLLKVRFDYKSMYHEHFHKSSKGA